jgi:transcriptional regulator
MYVPQAFRPDDVATMHDIMRSHPLATLVTTTDGGLDANHIPLLLDAEPAPYGTLRGHVARGNDMWQRTLPDTDVLVIFHGPDAYVSPSWYPSKRETGKAVPTWNYIVVHAHGRPRFIDDAAWLRAHVEALSAMHESGRSPAWQVTDAPAGYIDAMLLGIVGVEIPIARLAGKLKLSQNRTPADRDAVIAALESDAAHGARAVAAAMRARR